MNKLPLKIFITSLSAILLASCSGFKNLAEDWDRPLVEYPEPIKEEDGVELNSQNIDYGKEYRTFLNPDNDPFQQLNRYGFYINMDILDAYILRPIAVTNNTIVSPDISNALVTLYRTTGEPLTLLSNLATLQTQEAGKNAARLAINLFLGFGMIDWASEMGIYSNNNNFDYVAAKYNVKPGPYLMLPGLGPTYPRQLAFYYGLQTLVSSILLGPILPAYWLGTALASYNIVNTRSTLISQENTIYNSHDPYEVVKSIYIQNMNFNSSKAQNVPLPAPSAPAFDLDMLNSFN